MRFLAVILGRLLFGPPRIGSNPIVPGAYICGQRDDYHIHRTRIGCCALADTNEATR